jgi:ribosomal protein S18 acetylase RimI-like enzyme
LKAFATSVLGQYEIYRVLELNPDQRAEESSVRDNRTHLRPLYDLAQLSGAPAPEIQALARYSTDDAKCFVAEDQHSGEVVAACWFWFGTAYVRRNFWPLRQDEAKLVQITVAHAHRNRGVGQQLLHHASGSMFSAGFRRLYARVWHSHSASLAAFRKTGWREIALVVTAQPFGKTIRLVMPRRAQQTYPLASQ